MSLGLVLFFAMLSIQTRCGKSEPQLPPRTLFYEFMTHQTINRYATYIDSAHTFTATQLTFNPGTVDDALLLKVPLISAGQLSRRVPLTVKIVVGLDTSIGKAPGQDSDISYGITDGEYFHGFRYVDQNHPLARRNCHGAQGKLSDLVLTETVFGPYILAPPGQLYPGQAVITIRPDEQWGSCYTTHNGGFLNYRQYTTRLDLTKGIALEAYKTNKQERVGIKYIEVTVTQNH